ncbi:MAG TPA: glycoside hydrolase family 38 C-terminal domain-containing protein [Caulobacteraceae bacterium]|nr:glycoside hydrolase family 38 C-terminal domain-containing protein [Caulobacteraceae bacterium]
MHRLLPPSEAIQRARRRRDEIAAWRIRATAPIEGWRFDGAPIALGARWPARDGVHVLESGDFVVPGDWPLAETRLRLDVGGEALLTIRYASGARLPLGLDVNHTEFPLDEQEGLLEVEAVARGPFWTPVADPRLTRAALAWVEIGLDDFVRTLGLAIDLAAELEGHELFWPLLDLAEVAMARLDWPTATAAVGARQSRYAAGYEREMTGNPFKPVPLPEAARASIVESLDWMRGELRALQRRFPPQGAVALMGHAHIDTAWLWPIEETRRKVRRTFATAADLLRRHPHFRHAQSFAEYYRGLEDDDPALLEAVKAQVAAGRWEPVGGLWVEPDINMPSGESLVRQALYGQRYFERTFGQRHTAAWLPDTFGFTPALPQILKGAGLTSLYTVKIGWSETNRFPHSRFWWQGIDGTRLLVHHMIHPEDNYNGQVTPRSLLRVWRNNADKQASSETIYPIGFGDGGGGPTAEMIAAQAALADFPLVPATRFASVADYYAKARAEADAGHVETWAGELYLEYHRGVLTSQARTKRLHRQAEQALVETEFLGAAAHLLGGPAPASLEPLWRALMINQFHDILPGSSIPDVYVRTERELAEVVAAARNASDAALDDIAGRLGDNEEEDVAPSATALLIVNIDGGDRPVRLVSDAPIPGGQPAEDGYVLAADQVAPAFAAEVISPRPASGVAAASRVLENQALRLEFADDGTIARLHDKRCDREVLAGRGNQIWAYRDQPRVYDAWDIEGDFARVGEEIAAQAIEVVEAGGQRGALRIVREFRDSTIVQSVRLWANSARIDFATRLDWHDRRTLLKARFPLAIHADHATSECAFGVQRRPTHRNTSWDAAKFEVAAHRFVDLSEPGYGAALLNDGRYGHEALGDELAISLLRAPTLPDRLADEGAHEVTYALLPHAGAWHDADVLAEAEDLNRPLSFRVIRGASKSVPLIRIDTGPRLGLGALKPAEDGDGLILRLYEPCGARGPVEIVPPSGWRIAGEVSLLEDPIPPPSPLIRPFEIRSWRLAPAD